MGKSARQLTQCLQCSDGIAQQLLESSGLTRVTCKLGLDAEADAQRNELLLLAVVVAGFGLSISAAIAGAADATYNLLGPREHGPAAPFVAAAAFIANIGVLMCVPAVGTRLAERAGVPGLIGYALLSIGLAVLGVASYMINAVVAPTCRLSCSSSRRRV